MKRGRTYRALRSFLVEWMSKDTPYLMWLLSPFTAFRSEAAEGESSHDQETSMLPHRARSSPAQPARMSRCNSHQAADERCQRLDRSNRTPNTINRD